MSNPTNTARLTKPRQLTNLTKDLAVAQDRLAGAVSRIARLEEEVALCLRFIRVQAERQVRAIDPGYRARESAKA